MLIALPAYRDFKTLGLQESMNTEVISVSKVPEKLSEVASAIQLSKEQHIEVGDAQKSRAVFGKETWRY